MPISNNNSAVALSPGFAGAVQALPSGESPPHLQHTECEVSELVWVAGHPLGLAVINDVPQHVLPAFEDQPEENSTDEDRILHTMRAPGMWASMPACSPAVEDQLHLGHAGHGQPGIECYVHVLLKRSAAFLIPRLHAAAAAPVAADDDVLVFQRPCKATVPRQGSPDFGAWGSGLLILHLRHLQLDSFLHHQSNHKAGGYALMTRGMSMAAMMTTKTKQ